jgi:hypothetical protein
MHLISQRLGWSGVVAALLVVATANSAQAGPLNLVQHAPDVTSTFVLVNYSAGVFDALGTPVSFDVDGSAPPDYSIAGPGQSFHVHASINPLNGSLLSGTVSVTGKIASISATSGTLLTGNLTAFGFQNGGGDIFEFKFDVTGGDLAAAYYGSTGGVIIDAAGSNFTGSFTSSFTNDPDGFGFAVGVADTFPVTTAQVPEASSLALAGACIGLVAVGRKFRRSRRTA